jgi:hypothetical protein
LKDPADRSLPFWYLGFKAECALCPIKRWHPTEESQSSVSLSHWGQQHKNYASRIIYIFQEPEWGWHRPTKWLSSNEDAVFKKTKCTTLLVFGTHTGDGRHSNEFSKWKGSREWWAFMWNTG